MSKGSRRQKAEMKMDNLEGCEYKRKEQTLKHMRKNCRHIQKSKKLQKRKALNKISLWKQKDKYLYQEATKILESGKGPNQCYKLPLENLFVYLDK